MTRVHPGETEEASSVELPDIPSDGRQKHPTDEELWDRIWATPQMNSKDNDPGTTWWVWSEGSGPWLEKGKRTWLKQRDPWVLRFVYFHGQREEAVLKATGWQREVDLWTARFGPAIYHELQYWRDPNDNTQSRKSTWGFSCEELEVLEPQEGRASWNEQRRKFIVRSEVGEELSFRTLPKKWLSEYSEMLWRVRKRQRNKRKRSLGRYPILANPGEEDIRNRNRFYRSFRRRTGWTGEKRDKYIPGKHRCPSCGGDFDCIGSEVQCQDCGSRFPCDWSTYEPPLRT